MRISMKAWSALVVSAALVLIGAVPLLYMATLVGWQIVMLFQTGKWIGLGLTFMFTEHGLAFVPQFAPTMAPEHPALVWVLSRVHVGLLPALIGLLLVGAGVLGMLRQRAAMRARKQYREDRLRRVDDYRRDEARAEPRFDGRREPFIANY
jgi:uncharacterized membrane protein (DUF106 family)